MANDETNEDLEDWDPLKGADEGDGSADGFKEASDAFQDALGLTKADAEPVPQDDDDRADDTMP